MACALELDMHLQSIPILESSLRTQSLTFQVNLMKMHNYQYFKNVCYSFIRELNGQCDPLCEVSEFPGETTYH